MQVSGIVLHLTDSPFTIELGEPVTVVSSGEPGEVVGRSEFKRGEPSYHVEYERPDGVVASAWFKADQLTALEA